MDDLTDTRHKLLERYASTRPGHERAQEGALGRGAQAAFEAYFGRHLPDDHDAPVLDLGCGDGTTLQLLQARGHQDLAGVDLSPEQVERARQRTGLPVVHADARAFLRERPGPYAAVLAIDVLEHVPRDELLPLLQEIRASLLPGGRLILRSPNASGPFGASLRYEDLTHTLAFTPGSIRQALEVAGLGDVEVHEAGPVAHGPASLGRVALWKGIRSLLSLYLLAETGRGRGHILTQNLIAVARRDPGETSP